MKPSLGVLKCQHPSEAGQARSSSAIEKKARKSTGGVIATIRVHAKMSGLKPATLRREFYRKTPRIKKLPNQK
jgi:hypothetical protein